MSLSSHEQRILDRIASDLGQKDPDLATTFADTRLASQSWPRFPLSAAHTVALVLLLVLLVVAQPLAPVLGPAGPVIIAAAVILPWFVSAARRSGKG